MPHYSGTFPIPPIQSMNTVSFLFPVESTIRERSQFEVSSDAFANFPKILDHHLVMVVNHLVRVAASPIATDLVVLPRIHWRHQAEAYPERQHLMLWHSPSPRPPK